MSDSNVFKSTHVDREAHRRGLNAQQLDAVITPPDQPLQVLAGAGTGKTELISRRFIELTRRLHERGVKNPAEHILVLTFTSDAAASMRARINARLQTYGEPSESNDSAGVATGSENTLGQASWISTFHQACLRILRRHPLEAGLSPDFRVLDQLGQERLFHRVVRDIASGDAVADFAKLAHKYGLPNDFPSDVLCLERLESLARQMLKSSQEESSETRQKDMLGATLLDTLLNPNQLLSLINRIKTAGLSPAEFRKQAREQSFQLTQAIAELPLPHDPELKSVENLCAKFDCWRTALSGWSVPEWDPIANVVRKAALKGKDPDTLSASTYKAELEKLVNFYLLPRTYEPGNLPPQWAEIVINQENTVIDLITAASMLYQEALQVEGACDFDDLINIATRLLEQPAFGEAYQRFFEAVIVDEFQDSNNSQLRLLERLIRPGAKNLTVVGDEKQSIYGFRFAQPENLDLIFQHSESKRVSLQTNYRSFPSVLSAANQITTLLTERHDSHLIPSPVHAERFEPKVTMLTLDAVQFDVDEPELAMVKTPGKTKKPKAPSPEPISVQREWEAKFIAVEIMRLVGGLKSVEKQLSEAFRKYADIAILVPSHAKAESIQRTLRDYGIPSVRQKSSGFFDDPAIKNALALLRLLRHPYKAAPFVRLLQSKLSGRQIRELQEWRKSISTKENPVSLLDASLQLKTLPNILPSVSEDVALAIADLAEQISAARPIRTARFILPTFQALGEAIGLIDDRLPEWKMQEQRIHLRTFEKLLHLLSRSRRPAPSFDDVMDMLEGYVANPRLELPVKEDRGNENAVQILTTFAAKGLEFPVVFAAYTERNDRTKRSPSGTAIRFDPQYDGKNGFGLFLGKINGEDNPKSEVYKKVWEEPRALREAQRVFYVALTRAREKLYVIRSGQSYAWTAPDEFPTHAIQALSQSLDADFLDACYWSVEPTDVREHMLH